MATQSLYRKYRSQTFGDLRGQDHVVRTLQNAIASGRIAHSFLFTGPRGTGKTSTARLLAKALCCESGPTPEPNDGCEICRDIAAGSFVDVIEMDAASESGVDQIREQIVEAVEYRPMVARYKVFIVDEVHDLSAKAFDALLKTIEEPPPHIVFVLATTEYQRVPPTIRSRCQKFEFHRASVADLVARLDYVAAQEGVTAEPAAIGAIARMADGGFRDALTLLEQAILTSEDGHISVEQVYDQLGLVAEDTVDELLLATRHADVPRLLELLAEVARRGRDPRAILESMLIRLADLTRAAYDLDPGLDASRAAAVHEVATRLGRDRILALRGELASAHKAIRDITLPRLWLESELVRLAAPPAAGSAGAASPTRRAEPAPPRAAPAETPSASKIPAADPAPQDGKWEGVSRAIMAQSKKLAMRIADVQTFEVEGTKLAIVFERSMDYDWVTEKPKAVGMIEEAVRGGYGAGYAVEFRVRPRETRSAEPEAVELPREGAALDRLLRQTFDAGGPASAEETQENETR